MANWSKTVQIFSWVVLILVLVFFIVTLIFASIGICRGADQYELFRDLLSVILAIAGISIAAGGYLVYRVLMNIIEHRAENIYNKMGSADEVERLKSMANVTLHSGYTYWLFYKNTQQRSFLEDAIGVTERAYSVYAVNLDEHELTNQRIICTIRNNLAYYYAERQQPEDSKVAQDYAKYIYERITIFPDRRHEWEDTYNFVMARYP